MVAQIWSLSSLLPVITNKCNFRVHSTFTHLHKYVTLNTFLPQFLLGLSNNLCYPNNCFIHCCSVWAAVACFSPPSPLHMWAMLWALIKALPWAATSPYTVQGGCVWLSIRHSTGGCTVRVTVHRGYLVIRHLWSAPGIIPHLGQDRA